MTYTEGFKEQMVRRMLGGMSAYALANEVGVSQPALSRWLREKRSIAAMNVSENEKAGTPPPPRQRTAEERWKLLVASEGLTEQSLGEWLRREGVYEAELQEWRKTAATALGGGEKGGGLTPKGKAELAQAKKQVKELSRELRRKEKALAETAALLVLEKKLQALGWDSNSLSQGEEEDESSEPNESSSSKP